MATLFTDRFDGYLYDDINDVDSGRQGKWTYGASYTGQSVRMYLVSPESGYASRRVQTGQPGTARAIVDPSTPDYAVTVDYCLFTNLPSLRFGPTIRHQATDTYYTVWYQDGELVLVKRVAGVDTILSTWSGALNYGSGSTPIVYTLRLEANGSAIGAYLNGTLRVSATDTAITTAGRPGIQGRAVTASAYTGIHIDNYTVTDDTALALGSGQVIGFIGL